MASLKPVWTENQNIISTSTLGGTETATGDIDLDASGYDGVVIQVDYTDGSTPAAGIRVDLFGSADGGTTIDNIAFVTFEVDEGDSQKKSLFVEGRNWIRVSVTNLDTDSGDDASVTVDFAGRVWTVAA
jgi:hypothetical protein